MNVNPMPDQTHTILLVDSDQLQRDWTARVLRNRGLRVLEARSFQGAKNIFGRHPGEISLLVTAMTLPESNGYTLAEKLRASQPGMKVLFVSGPTGAALSSFHEAQNGGSAILFRPCEGEDLLQQVDKLLENGQDSAAAGG